MAKYDALTAFLASQHQTEIPMTFAEVARAARIDQLPRSAILYRMWWSNNTSNHVHAKAWIDAGYETTQVDMDGKRLVFRRIESRADRPQERSGGKGMSDTARSFEQEGTMKTRCHPAWGALKGTFTIAPGTDLTAPMYSDEEWAEIEKEMEADWDRIAEGMRGHKA